LTSHGVEEEFSYGTFEDFEDEISAGTSTFEDFAEEHSLLSLATTEQSREMSIPQVQLGMFR
jgi:hypothetical protein